ncbi:MULTISPECIES: heavy-metal-associated domain-containing protein [Kangiella]|uniref:Heavy metal transport/detoxification protein n=1 Tax=Kangiella koreensis (strain DSM 16069 / JCM 12317 / KCTC 12182 / SW-125) TaxID=523791 RepID=C7RBU6_KANKD|nr:heavy-metal-associated domain-containing protein [Kangiella koreensis]ACV26738.1 Heavy metal transport/detoxification protein [Kangiella koreensis DSM 16069]
MSFLVVFSALVWSASAFSASKHYQIRVDGLACPYCAYGIEKKLMKIDGVTHVDIDLKKGLVIVVGNETLVLKDSQLKTLFNDAGFTFRKIEKVELINNQ